MKTHPLLEDQSSLASQGVFRATTSAHGSYNTFQFVLRLSPEVHRKLESVGSGVHSSAASDPEVILAFSTYLHETVHWWQHVGSTYGFVMSMTYPAQAHSNHKHLKLLADDIGLVKPLRQLAENVPSTFSRGTRETINTVVNTHYDIDAYRRLTVSPIDGNRVLSDKFFESVGHSYHIAYGNVISLLSTVSDRNFELIPHPKEWHAPFQKFKQDKVEGFYYGSPVGLFPFGAYEIFEGQARFAQLQYLSFASDGKFDFQQANNYGMFGDVYWKAFETFLEICGLEQPSNIDHPVVALFLLICDISINLGGGFPFRLAHHKTFIQDHDPATRFVTACMIVKDKCPELFSTIVNYSREEYEYVSTEICSRMLEEPPLKVAETFLNWWDSDQFKGLRSQYERYQFEDMNITVRILFSHFLAFMSDKFRRPEFFCWPGAWMAGDRVSNDAEDLFEKHAALYVDKEHDDGVFPRLIKGQSEADIQQAFDGFYLNNVVFDLTRQWISEPGPFRFQFEWLSQTASSDQLEKFAREGFFSLYGVKLDDAKPVQ